MRAADAHLTPQEFELLLFGAVDSNSGKGVASEAQKHLGECSVCQSIAEKYHRTEEALKSLQDHCKSYARENAGRGNGSGCPAADTWPRLAVGLISKDEVSHYVAHASTCGRCGPLLRDAVEVMSEEVTSEEQEFLAIMITPEWQRETARKMAGLHVKKTFVPPAIENKQAAKEVFWRFVLRPSFVWAGAGLALIVMATAGWFVWLKTRGPVPDQLLRQAYTEDRMIELRIQGAHHGPLRVERSAKKLPPLVLEAEAQIRHQLEKQPHDSRLLQLLGRAELLEWNYLPAIDNLKHALDLSPDSSSIRIDLASAYFERAEDTGTKSDYQKASELLGQALQKNPDDPIALFNRAILAEKALDYQQAVVDWEHYLRLWPNDEWSQEASERLDDLKRNH